jgi:C1A family cysteine protease
MEILLAQRGGSGKSLSPQFIFYQSKQIDGTPSEDGTWAACATKTIVDSGVCGEALWPYESDVRLNDVTHGSPPDDAVADALQRRAASVIQLDPRDSGSVRDMLDDEMPVQLSLPVYRNWYQNPATAQYGIIPMPLPGSALVGGHAMCAMGYGYDSDEVSGGWYFILKNSWGIEWAPASVVEPGYGIIPFRYIDKYGWEAYSLRI